jgi:DNA mismatch repair protein MutS
MQSEATPLIKQYLSFKESYKEEILFFQVGDFYELFFEDAKLAAQLLSITLTKRGIFNGEYIPLCGVPVHMIEQYYAKLVKKGYTVALCSQLSKPEKGKVVKRGITEIITPSTIMTDDNHDTLYSLFITANKETITTFFFDFTQQEVIYKKYTYEQDDLITLKSTFEKYQPREIITFPQMVDYLYDLFPRKISIKGFNKQYTDEKEITLFLKEYNLEKTFFSVVHLFISYLKSYFQNILKKKILIVKKDTSESYLFLDKASITYLECAQNLLDGKKENTLYGLLDKTATKMGSRLLKKWLLFPLKNEVSIHQRQQAIQYFLKETKIAQEYHDILSTFGDIERLFNRIRLDKMRGKDFFTLLNFAHAYRDKEAFCQRYPAFKENFHFPDMSDVTRIIEKTINGDETLHINNQPLFCHPTCDQELYEKFSLVNDQESVIASFCQEEKERTGIEDLVIKKTPLYNYVFELSKIKEKKYELPKDFIRVQTLTQKERYVSQKLQTLSQKLLYAESAYLEHEEKIKKNLLDAINTKSNSLLSLCTTLAEIDVYISLALCAREHGWTFPTIKETETKIDIKHGRHPIASQKISHFITNSLVLDEEQKNHLITGPNMGGKSTYMKQNALHLIMGHIGSAIAAQEGSSFPLLESILTRVGAADSLHEGKSTFYTELEELHTIISRATAKSFIIIDEIGRGTSTYDGISLATSILDYLITKKNAFLLCSTHYHEIETIMGETALFWYHMKSHIIKDNIIFLYTLAPGKAEGSMGILLAKKIGFPSEIIDKSFALFDTLQRQNTALQREHKIPPTISEKSNTYEELLTPMFSDKSTDDITPREAHELLTLFYKEWKRK